MGSKWVIRVEATIGTFENGLDYRDFYINSLFEYCKIRFLYNGKILFIRKNFY